MSPRSLHRLRRSALAGLSVSAALLAYHLAIGITVSRALSTEGDGWGDRLATVWAWPGTVGRLVVTNQHYADVLDRTNSLLEDMTAKLAEDERRRQEEEALRRATAALGLVGEAVNANGATGIPVR